MKNNKLNKTVLLSALLVEMGVSAQAATIDVDGVICNFNDAIVAANSDTATGGCVAGNGPDVLTLPNNALINLTATAVVDSEVTVNGNGSTVQPDPNGAGFALMVAQNGGDLKIYDTDFRNGVGTGSTYNAGGLLAAGSSLYMRDSSVSQVQGGGIVIFDSLAVLNAVTVSETGNAAFSFYGSALTVANNSNVIVSNSTFYNNNNTDSETGGTITVNGYFSGSVLTMRNSTISGNTTAVNGGGIGIESYGNLSDVYLENMTIVNNSSSGPGGGIYNDASHVTVAQTIISGNTDTLGTEISSMGGSVTVNNYNLFGLNNVSGLNGVTIGASDIVPVEANLSDIIELNLRDNGGTTLTHTLNPTGPAVDAIPAASCLLNEDQTGNSRPIDADGDGNADCDIGAIENLDIIFRNFFE